jgi:transcriptional regulator with XRE-family HTH domain
MPSKKPASPTRGPAPARPSKAAVHEVTLRKYLGRALRDHRRQHALTISQVAELARISSGMLSKIENGQVAPTLDVIERTSTALGLTLGQLFQKYAVPDGSAQQVKAGQGMEVVRVGTKRGHTYHLLAYGRGPRKLFEPFLITMNDQSEAFPSFQHEGTEFIYMLQGKIAYRHGRNTYRLEPGDALTFAGDVLHGPEYLIEVPIRFLSIIMYAESNSE